MIGILCWGTVITFFVLLGVIAWTDCRTMRIPDKWNLALLATGVCAVFVVPGPELVERLSGMFAVSFPMLLVATVAPGGVGGGDIKLMAAGGLFLGWKGIVLAAVLGLSAGGVCGAFLLVFRGAGRKDVFPLGPCLCGGMMAAFVILCIHGS